MKIIEFIVLIITSVLSAFVKLDLAMILDGFKVKLKTSKLIISTIILSTYIFFSYLITDNAIKVIIDFGVVIFCIEYITNFKRGHFVESVITAFIIWVVMLIIDIFFSIVLSLFGVDLLYINENVFVKFFMTALVCILLTVVFLYNKFRLFLNGLMINANSFKNFPIVVCVLLSVIMFSVSAYICLFNYDAKTILITIFLMITIYTFILIFTINEFYQKNRIQSEYDILLKNLNEYENLLDLQRVSNHENKNQLLVIKGMIEKREVNVSEYIDLILDTQYKDNDAIIFKTNRIPSGGLRGLVYYKILTMKEYKIESNLDVDRSLKDLNFDSIPIKTNQELCKIVGVFLDNAIQAVSKLKKKAIDIYLKYENAELYVKVSNNYSGVIELDKIDNSGYTTKGKGHGYGLSLVKGIIKDNENFKNVREINGKMFSQIIILKVK